MRPAVVQIALLRAHLDALQQSHIARSRTQVFETSYQLDEVRDVEVGYHASDAGVRAAAVGGDFEGDAVGIEFHRIWRSFGIFTGIVLPLILAIVVDVTGRQLAIRQTTAVPALISWPSMVVVLVAIRRFR